MRWLPASAADIKEAQIKLQKVKAEVERIRARVAEQRDLEQVQKIKGEELAVERVSDFFPMKTSNITPEPFPEEKSRRSAKCLETDQNLDSYP